MAVNRLTFSNDLKAKDLCYSDEFFKLKSEKVIPSDSFTFDSYDAFKNLVDYKTNNYSNLFLINKQRNSNWLESVTNKDELDGLATTISWLSDDDKQQQKGLWLYFGKNYEMWDASIKKIDALITHGRPNKNYFNHIFYLQFLNQSECRISHTFGDMIFYLSVDENKVVRFKRDPQQGQEIFVYNREGNKLKLYKKVLHKQYDVNDEVIKKYYGLYILGVERKNGQNKIQVFDVSQQSTEHQIFINEQPNDFNFYVDSSWISYDRSKFISSVNSEKSSFNLQSQALIHHQYNKEDGMNFVPLKNNLSYKGNVINGSYLNVSYPNKADVNFRTYTSIQSGFNQEKGFDNITLTFNFYDQEIEVNDGDEIYFTIGDDEYGTNGLPPMWPFKFININDTKFVKNGAFGSSVPYFSDTVKKLQNNRSKIKESANNGTYLCSWLYKKDLDTVPVWLDRYYYPEIISKDKALKQNTNFKQSFQNILDKNYTSDKKIKNKVHKLTHFDKVSDLVLQGGNSYVYKRISKSDVNELVQSLEGNRIKIGLNQKNKEVDLLDTFYFDKENYLKLNYKDWKNTNKINFNTDIYLSKKKRMGIQIFGNDYSSGFTIQNRKDLIPYHYYSTDSTIYLMNNKFQLIHSFEINATYGDTIRKVILGDTFDDVYVITDVFIYVFAYDLRLKTRIDLRKYEQSVYDVLMDENGQGVFGTDVVSNYPYVYTEKKIDKPILNKGYVQNGNFTLPVISKKTKKPVCSTMKRFRFYGEIKGSHSIQSALSKKLSESNSIAYKNNLFIPIGSRILKVIFCPSNKIDEEIFNGEISKDFPCAVRWLYSNEFVLNYASYSLGNSTQEVSIQNGFIQVQNKIKNIFIDEDQMVYGFNFDKIAPSPDGDTVYGLYNWDKYVATGGWQWLFNQSLAKMKSDVSTAKYAQFASPNSIDMVKMNEDGYMCLIRNFNNLPDNEYEDNNKRMEIYDKTKTRVYQYDLSSYQKVHTLDSYNYIDEAHQQRKCFTAIVESFSMMYHVTFYCDTNNMSIKQIDVPYQILPTFNQINNSDSLLRYRNYNALYFNLHVPSPYIYDFIGTIKWDLTDIQQGWYNINAEINLDDGYFQIKINDQVLGRLDETNTSWFEPHVFSNGTVFNNTYYIGCLGKRYGTTINKILKNAIYDPYVCKNGKMKNIAIYNKSLSFHQYQAMRLRDAQINRINLTLPCGVRSGIDEIVRYFKYNSSPSISNNVKINISGTGLKTQGQFELLRKELLTALENEKDCLVKIKEIEFV